VSARSRSSRPRGARAKIPRSAPVMRSGKLGQSAEKLIRQALRAVESRGSVNKGTPLMERAHFGTTIFIASCELKMRMGRFTVYVFQDLIHKGYILAIAYGEIHKAKELYTRLHSSCVTSETLRGCDCDCSKQLEGALKRIAERKAGILFYLIQEGRGVGYVAKARDRMLVQASLDELSTFEAYACMGLKKDYRNYEGIASIVHLLGVKAPFVVLTNNPDKVDALKELGVKVKGTESIEFDAGPYNLAYLKSKAQSGHALKRPALAQLRRAIPPEKVVPFNPYALKGAARFIYCASYFLPMKPVDGETIISRAQFEEVFKHNDLAQYRQGPGALIREVSELDRERVLVCMDRRNFARYRSDPAHAEVVALVTTPYWFRVHVYYDVVSGQDFVVLTHGESRGFGGKGRSAPLVRVHSESIFDRFPMTDVENRDKLKQSAKMIVRNGAGLMVLLYNDGRGAGFGAHATDRMFRERRVTNSSDETYTQLGVPYDSRDYEATMLLIAHHVRTKRIQMIMNNPHSLVLKQEYAMALHRQGLQIDRWIFLEDEFRS
jgi:3,4-dihydroxy 2-butanone 4-phosphate synthase/GTP cyclohydrolase II